MGAVMKGFPLKHARMLLTNMTRVCVCVRLSYCKLMSGLQIIII